MSKPSAGPNGSKGPSEARARPTLADHLVGPTLTVWIYDSALGAAAGHARMRRLKESHALKVHDAVTVSWIPGAHQPRIGHPWHETSAGAARGSALGGLVDLIFLSAGDDAAGGDLASLASGLRGTGIDRTFLDEFRGQLRPETSALVVLSGHGDLGEVRPVIERGLARGDVVLMHALLEREAPDIIRATVRELQSHSQGR